MNNESAVHAAREACKGKTFASDPDAFKDLEAARFAETWPPIRCTTSTVAKRGTPSGAGGRMLNFLADWRYWVALLIGCIGLILAEHGQQFFGAFANGFAIGVAYFTHPKEAP